jgi:two-component system alkaline phosphatase synthesis response regulator PhoP
MPLVCLVGSQAGVGGLAQSFLDREALSVRTLSAGPGLIQRMQDLRPSLIMVDTMISNNHGLDLCRTIRKNDAFARTPVILMAAKASEEERVAGLELGADDYISEFSSKREFVARVNAVMRRFRRPAAVPASKYASVSSFPYPFAGPAQSTIKTEDIEIDTSAMKISIRGNEIETTTLEYRLMFYLAHHRARVFSRDQLLDAVWGAQYVSPRSVDACVRRLRRKIEPNQASPTYLKTIRGAGYCLAAGRV